MAIKIMYSIFFLNFFSPFLVQFLDSANQQVDQANGNHCKPDKHPAEKVRTSDRKTILRIPPELRFKKHFQSHDPPADKEKYSPRHNGIMSAFTMPEKLRKVIMQQTHYDRKINKEYGSENISKKIPERKCTCRIKDKNKHDRYRQQWSDRN